MADWPATPLATMTVQHLRYDVQDVATDATSIVASTIATQQAVLDPQLDFTVNCVYTEARILPGGISNTQLFGHYFYTVSKWDDTAGWVIVDQQDMFLDGQNNLTTEADGSVRGSATGAFHTTVTMTDLLEQYLFELECDLYEDPAYSTATQTIVVQAGLGEGFGYLGDFSLDFMPVAIVYCPPGQDMTNSLTQSATFGTRFNVGMTSGMSSDTSWTAALDLGLLGESFGGSSSQSMTNQSESGVQISHFRTTMVTADNQKAIGRAYFGPLGDLFVIAVNPRFATSKRADGTVLYSLKAIEQVFVIPAWKLLRPGTDAIASLVPDDARRNILALDPFITNLDRFFPDSGADLAEAADPYADPSPNNRAEIIGRWWPVAGAEINYSVGDSHQLHSSDTNQLDYGTTGKVHVAAGANADAIKVAVGFDESMSTTLGYQVSKESDGTVARNAACLLIRNQNVQDPDGIQIYYDRIFSTFMFRKVRSGIKYKVSQLDIPPVDRIAVLAGSVRDHQGSPLRGLQIYLEGQSGSRLVTSADKDGNYSFYNVGQGEYTLVAGDRHASVTVDQASSVVTPTIVNVDGARRVLDFKSAAVWEVAAALQLPVKRVAQLRAQIVKADSLDALLKATKAPPSIHQNWAKAAVFPWDHSSAKHAVKPKAPAHKAKDRDHDRDDRRGPKKPSKPARRRK